MPKRILHHAPALALLLFVCACSDTPSDTNPTDMRPGVIDMTSDMKVDVEDMRPDEPDMKPPTCETAQDCMGDFAGWQCIDDVCVDCSVGDEACVCRANGTCKDGLRCDDDSLCVACTDGLEACSCRDDDANACDEGLICDEDVCVPDPCVDGALDCPCDNGSCVDEPATYCDGVMCQACSSDVEGCACEADGTCKGENYCGDDDTCAACPEEDKPAQCVCDSDIDCASGLACDETTGRCRDELTCEQLCVPNQVCDVSGIGDPICVMEACVDGYEWDAGSQTCVELVAVTCDGRDGSTDQGAVCDAAGQACVEINGGAECVDTCETIAAQCAMQNQECEPAQIGGEDAVCGGCLPGYALDGGGACVIDMAANCAPLGAIGSIVDACSMRNRLCQELAPAGAQCGDCLDGYTLDAASNTCVEEALCGGDYCAPDEFCEFPQTGGPPSCVARQCGPSEALDATSGSCQQCNLTCDQDGVYPTTVDGACACASDVFCTYQFDGAGTRCAATQCAPGEARTPAGQCKTCNTICGNAEGERARHWPVTTLDGDCICETQEGYYKPFGMDGVPLACDEDRDGWINRTAKSTYDAASNVSVGGATEDAAVLANFRCDLREIDRFTLINEWRQERHVGLCDNDMIDWDPNSPHGCVNGLTRLTLFESDDLDSSVSIANDTSRFPRYGSRALDAAELNSLTKLCVSQSADFNDNSVQDIAEEHAINRTRLNPSVTFTGVNADEEFAFHSVAYFAEIHRGYYREPSNFAFPGSYVIEERSRCEATFPLGYLAGVSGYWQSCTRNRRADFNFASSQSGFDFGHYSCSDTNSGSCATLEPALVDPPVDLDNDNIDDHGLCDQTGPLVNMPWRGMSHHSQFQCVVLKTSPNAANDYELSVNDVYEPGEVDPLPYEFNDCVANDCAAGMIGCSETANQGIYQPLETELTCLGRERTNVVADQVGWVAARYIPESSNTSLAHPYQRGCVDESFGLTGNDGWASICPGYAENPDGVLAAGNPGDSGKLICSCNRFYGGSDCSVACKQRSTLPQATNDNTCPTGNNGVCDDGGEGATTALCALGTDLADCGLRYRPATSFLHVGDKDRNYSTEELAAYACSDADNYCSLHPPIPAEGYSGGRRGYWMCGDNNLTFAQDANGKGLPFLQGDNSTQKTYSLEGSIKVVPVKRELLQEPGCTSGCYSLF